MSHDTILERYKTVMDQVQTAVIKSNRNPANLQVVVVTKRQPIEKVMEVIRAGATILGENYPEEANKKILEMREFSQKVQWHMIGHLQTRKVKFVASDFSMIHSIDRIEIAEELNTKLTHPLKALLEVNLSGEISKGGFMVGDQKAWPEFVNQLNKVNQLPNLEICGLMTMPPLTGDPESSRTIFKKCRELSEYVQKQTKNEQFNQLSMGTSVDFSVAIDEGATFIRIGEAIMGPRFVSK
jgi:pyridoxal phosphate enzyme (YggS family)